MRTHNKTTDLIEKAINEIEKNKGEGITNALIRDTCKKHDVLENSVRAIMGW